MSKPDWSDAPNICNWLAKDGSGQWCWFVHKPYLAEFHWMPSLESVEGDSFYDADGPFENDEPWKETLEPRP